MSIRMDRLNDAADAGADWEIIERKSGEIPLLIRMDRLSDAADAGADWEIIERKSGEIPLLMLPPKEYDYGSINFMDVSKGKGSLFQVTFPEYTPDHPRNPVDGPSRYFSSRGWLLNVISLFNGANVMTLVLPFSRLKLELPSVKDSVASDPCGDSWFYLDEGGFVAFYLTKFALSSSNPDSLQVMIIHGRNRHLAYTRPGDHVWREIKNASTATAAKQFFDVIYSCNQFYAINNLGQIFAVKEDDDTALPVTELPAEFIGENAAALDCVYMVESSDDDGALFVVSRRGVHVSPCDGKLDVENTYRTSGFDVFKVDLSSKKWSKMKSLGNKSLFLGINSSICVDASSNNSSSEYSRPNCIYFTDDFVEPSCYWYVDDLDHVQGGGKDTGIYHMEDGSIVPFAKPYHPFNPLMWFEKS